MLIDDTAVGAEALVSGRLAAFLADSSVPSRRAGAGAAWTLASRAATQTVQLLAFVVLAHVLTPSDFGLAASVIVLTSFALLFTDLGLGSALIQLPALRKSDIATAMWVSLVTGIALSLGTWAISSPVAGVLRHPELARLLPIGGLVFALSFGTVQTALLERTLRMRQLFICEALAALLGSAASVAAGAIGWGTVSIVIGPVATACFLTIFLWATLPLSLNARPTRAALARIWKRSSRVVGFNTINYWARNTDNLLLSRFASPATFGFYARAYSLMLAPITLVSFSIARVLFPFLAHARRTQREVGPLYLGANAMACAVLFPVTLLMAVTATRFVPLLFGPSWEPMSVLVTILALSGPPQVLNGLVGSLYQSLGQNSAMLRRGALFSGITVLCFVGSVHWGPVAMATTYAVGSYLFLPFALALPLRLAGLTLLSLARSLVGVVTASAALAVACLLVARIAPGTSWASLLLQVLAGAGAYALALWLAQPTLVRRLIGVLMKAPSQVLDSPDAP